MDREYRQSQIEAALRAHHAELKRFVSARASASDADDILQIAAMRAVEKADSLHDPARVRPWLFQIHRNVATDFARQQVSEQRRLDAFAAEPSSNAVGEEVAPSCRCSLEQARQLNSRYAAILDLVDIGGASLKEAARALGVTVNTATVRLHRARKALKERLMAHCGVETMRECVDCRCTSDRCCPT